MRSVKEQYWRYSLFVIILVLGVVIFAELTPYIGGLLGAMTIYVLLRRQMRYLTVRRRWRRGLAASVLLVEAIVCFLIPLSGVVTCFATILPVVGTALVWVPLAAYLAVEGSWGAAVGLMAYGVLVVTQSDNVIRFILQKRMADTHPLVTILGVLIGLPLFGFMGVIFGPLLLAMFVFFVHIFKRKYLDGAETARLFVPDR